MKIYELTKKIHKLLPKVEKKFGVKIDVENDTVIFVTDILDKTKINYKENYIDDTGSLMSIEKNGMCIASTISDNSLYAIESPQIRKILIALDKMLGENPRYTEYKKAVFTSNHPFASDMSVLACSLTPESKAEALCNKWLDGLNQMIDRKPEVVLEELVEILEELNNK